MSSPIGPRICPVCWAACGRSATRRVSVVCADGPINANMARLWEAFKRTRARYWVFLDDDIEFLGGDVLGDCVKAMVRHRWAGCSIYSTFDPDHKLRDYEPWRRELLEQGIIEERDAGWMTGYFMLVDREQVGDIGPDMASAGSLHRDRHELQRGDSGARLAVGPGSARVLPHQERGLGAESGHPQGRAVSPRQVGHVLLGLRAVHGLRVAVAGRGELAARATGVP